MQVQDGRSPLGLMSCWGDLRGDHLPPPLSSPLPRLQRIVLSDLEISCQSELFSFNLSGVFNLYMPSDFMATIQKLYEVCKVSLSEKGPMSPEAVDNVRAVLDMIRPSDVGLECEAQAVRFWRSPRAPNRKTVFHSGPAIRYRHIYECKSFSIGIFCIPASSIIPLHNHPGMTVLSKLLYGAVHVKSYDWIDTTEPLNLLKVRPAKVVRDGEMSAPCGAMVLHPTDGGNIHAFKAITPCAILDIVSPPYSSEDGRHCSYFRRCPQSDPSGVLLNRTKGSEFVWLEEYQPPDSFVIRRDLYTGPALNL